MTNWKTINTFHVPQEVWDKAEVKAKEWGWTVEAVLCDSLEKSFDYSEKENEDDNNTRFYVHTYFDNIFSYVVVEAIKRKDKDNDFVGKMNVSSKESLLKIAEEGYGILGKEIEFVD